MNAVKASYRRTIIAWLATCAALVVLMLLLGGYTRLSGAGLSITEWKPVHGVIPPIGLPAWLEEFDAYRATPQFQQINSDMTLEEFQSIFWPEYIHRLLGRIIGLAFLLPFIWLAKKHAFNRKFGLKLAGIFALGGLQGFMGWYMVKSGLSEGPYVSHLRLAAHLSLALLIFGLLWWTMLSVIANVRENGLRYPSYKDTSHSLGTLITVFALLCLQIIYGALLAGLHGGLIYNTWPTMDGHWIPSDMWSFKPWWHNLFANIACVQFIHRWLALIVASGALFWWWKSHNHAIAAVVLVQVALGIATLTHQVPLALGMAHQFTALLLFTLLLTALHKLRLKL